MGGITGKPTYSFREILTGFHHKEMWQKFDEVLPPDRMPNSWELPKKERKEMEQIESGLSAEIRGEIFAREAPFAELVFRRQSERTQQVLTLLGWPPFNKPRMTYRDAGKALGITGPAVREKELKCFDQYRKLRVEGRSRPVAAVTDPTHLSAGG